MEKIIIITVLILIFARFFWEGTLSFLNMAHVRCLSKAPPQRILEVMDARTYAKAVDYTLTKERFSLLSGFYKTLALLVVLLSGILPWAYSFFATADTSKVLLESLY